MLNVRFGNVLNESWDAESLGSSNLLLRLDD